jgi:hypothetical protein
MKKKENPANLIIFINTVYQNDERRKQGAAELNNC